jgi:ribonuclease III
LLKIFSKSLFTSSADKALAKRIFLITGVKPTNVSLYHQALRHSSAAVEIKEGVKNSNERLEFLGDAVLGIIVAEHLFKLYPFKGEGFLTKIRSRIVNRNQLNEIALKIGLNELIVSDVKGARTGSIHGDALEALIGAIYLDKGFETTRKFIVQNLLKFHVNIDELEQTDTDYKSRLLNWGQQNKKKVSFELIGESGPPHNKLFTIQVMIENEAKLSFQHHSKRRAEQLAAQLTMEEMGIA